MLTAANVSPEVLKLKGLEALKDVADGNATKIFVPTDLTDVISNVAIAGDSFKSGMENPAAKKAKPIDTTDKHMASAKNPINEEISEGFIPRIAEEISYINVPAGDIPNVQVDGWRAASSQGIKVTDGMKISFHTMSLPTARLVWHCASIPNPQYI